MKSKSIFRQRNLKNSIFPTALFVAVSCTSSLQAAEAIVNEATVNINVGPGDTVWFDSINSNEPIPFGTINGSAPAVGPLPGWAHTQASFVKFDGANVVEVPSGEKVEGVANLLLAGPTSVFYTTLAGAPFSTLTASQSIGLLETSRDFLINNGSTLDVAMGGMLFHGNSHWVKTDGNTTGSITSSSGQLVVAVHGTATDYQINRTVVKDFDAGTSLRLVKAGPGTVALGNNANTYTGGTIINNGRLQANNLSSFGTGTVTVNSDIGQIFLNVGSGGFSNTFSIQGEGPVEGGVRHGALRLANNATIGASGSVWVDGPTRISVNNNGTATLAGALVGTADLEISSNAGAALNGTFNLTGSGESYTGTVFVRKGGLNVSGTLGGSVVVDGDASLGGEGVIYGDVVLGGDIPSRLVFNGATEGALHILGDVDVTLGTTIITSTGAPPVAGEPVTVFSYEGTLTGDISNILTVGIRDGVLTHDVANKRVLASFVHGSLADLVWTGEVSSQWALDGTNNFFSGGLATSFINGDSVIFNDTALVKNVQFGGEVLPGSVVFDHAEEYQLTGTGGIKGAASFTKRGAGRLTLGGEASSYTGPIAIEAGTLRLGHSAALGASTGITIHNGGQLDIAGFNPHATGRVYAYTIAGAGPDGNGAIHNSGAGLADVVAGINTLTLTGDATVGGNNRFDLGQRNGGSVLNGNGHTLTKVGNNQMAFRMQAHSSVTRFVIAQGTVIAEDTNNALGGATGTATVKAGATLTSWGTRNFPNSVTLESGSILGNIGNGTSTWSGSITVQGDVTVAANVNGAPLIMSGNTQGNGSITKTGSQNVTIANPGYTGNTTVNGGTLVLGAATLADTSTVTIGSGAVLQLNHSEADTIGMLIINGEARAAGSYGATGSGAAIIDDTHFSGSGVLNVTGVVGGGGYEGWAASHGIAGEAPDDDFDGDGVLNGIEFVIGGDPKDGNSLALLPTSQINGDHLDFVFRRTSDSGSYSPHAEYGSDLAGWIAAEAGVNGVLVSEDADHFAAGIDRVTVRIPRTLAADGKIFARLTVAIP